MISNTKMQCCGCAACANVCPVQCISMVRDEEGFEYPSVNRELCINCGRCEQVCPFTKDKKDSKKEGQVYLVRNKDPKVLAQSTSGGAFTPIAQEIIRRNGVVYGAAFGNNDFYDVLHIRVDNEKDLEKFRSSKYVQSSTGKIYSQVKRDLMDGRWVVFSGTPCQIEGLKLFLGKEYEKLVTVDVECRAVPSPLIWKKYLDFKKEKLHGTVDLIRFRDKKYGYTYSTMSIYYHDSTGRKKEYHKGIEADEWLRAFFSGAIIRPCCNECPFRNCNHNSDFTIWDCFDAGKIDSQFKDDVGTTRMRVQTEKGKKLLPQLEKGLTIVPYSEKVEQMKLGREVSYAENVDFDRKKFFQDAQELDPKSFFTKYYPQTLKVRTLSSVRQLCYKIGIYQYAREFWKLIKRAVMR